MKRDRRGPLKLSREERRQKRRAERRKAGVCIESSPQRPHGPVVSGGRCRACNEKLQELTPEQRAARFEAALLVRCPSCFREPGQPCIVITRHPDNATPAGELAPRPHWRRIEHGMIARQERSAFTVDECADSATQFAQASPGAIASSSETSLGAATAAAAAAATAPADQRTQDRDQPAGTLSDGEEPGDG